MKKQKIKSIICILIVLILLATPVFANANMAFQNDANNTDDGVTYSDWDNDNLMCSSNGSIVVLDNYYISMYPGFTVGGIITSFDSMIECFDSDHQLLLDSAKVGTGMIIESEDKGNYSVIVPGDVDGNGSVNAADARSVLRSAARLEILEGCYLIAADVNGDGNVQAADARVVLRIAAKLLTIVLSDTSASLIIPVTEKPTTTQPTTQPTTKPTTQPTTKPTTQPTTKPTTQPTTKPTTQPTTTPTTNVISFSYVGNINSRIFHKSTCPSVKKMKDKNKVYYSSREEFIQRGYKPCDNCHP